MNSDKKERVLHIDDHEANRYAVRRILERLGLEVLEAATAREGLAAMSKDPDLVILDIKLPDQNGYEVCRIIKADPRYASTPVLQMSANFTATHDKVEGLESGADGYLAQPIESAVLVATVKSLLRIRRGERERAKLISELQEERDLRERFIATLSHDLRTPLAAVQVSAQLLQKSSPTDSVNRLASRIVSSIRRADSMIQDLLDASVLKAGQKLILDMESVDLQELVAQVLEERKLQAPAAYKYELISDELPNGNWNRDSIRRALENLLSNAHKYGDNAREITVLLEARPEGVEIRVHNYGNPIVEAEQGSLFEAFRRGSGVSVQRGWGLGLPLVRGLIEAHGGSVAVQSSAEEGTFFIIKLPWNSASKSNSPVTESGLQ